MGKMVGCALSRHWPSQPQQQLSADNMMKLPEFAGNFRVLPTVVRRVGRFFFFSRKTPVEVIAKVEAALKQLSSSGELEKLSSNYVLQ
jgi:hypothetical protein